MKRYKTAILFTFFIVVIFIYLIITLKPEITKIINVEQTIQSKTSELQELDRKLSTLKANEMQNVDLLKQTKTIYKPDVASSDVESSFTVIFDDIIEMARYNAIKIYSIGYTYNPPEDEVVKSASANYNVCLVTMQIIGDYTDTESFFRELYKYPYLLNLDKIESIPYSKNKKIIITNLQLKLYSKK